MAPCKGWFIDGIRMNSLEHARYYVEAREQNEKDLIDQLKGAQYTDGFHAKKIYRDYCQNHRRFVPWSKDLVEQLINNLLEDKPKYCHGFKEELLESGNRVLWEACRDLIWGCGWHTENYAWEQWLNNQWPQGDNRMGRLLMDKRRKWRAQYHEEQRRWDESRDGQRERRDYERSEPHTSRHATARSRESESCHSGQFTKRDENISKVTRSRNSESRHSGQSTKCDESIIRTTRHSDSESRHSGKSAKCDEITESHERSDGRIKSVVQRRERKEDERQVSDPDLRKDSKGEKRRPDDGDGKESETKQRKLDNTLMVTSQRESDQRTVKREVVKEKEKTEKDNDQNNEQKIEKIREKWPGGKVPIQRARKMCDNGELSWHEYRLLMGDEEYRKYHKDKKEEYQERMRQLPPFRRPKAELCRWVWKAFKYAKKKGMTLEEIKSWYFDTSEYEDDPKWLPTFGTFDEALAYFARNNDKYREMVQNFITDKEQWNIIDSFEGVWDEGLIEVGRQYVKEQKEQSRDRKIEEKLEKVSTEVKERRNETADKEQSQVSDKRMVELSQEIAECEGAEAMEEDVQLHADESEIAMMVDDDYTQTKSSTNFHCH